MRYASLGIVAVLVASAGAMAEQPAVNVTGIRAIHRHGQTFVTWQDAAVGEAGANFRYVLYRSEQPITQDNLAKAELCYGRVANNSAKMFGAAFYNITEEEAAKTRRPFGMSRLNPNTPVFKIAKDKELVPTTMPTFIIEEGGSPLPMWSGLAVRTARVDGKSYYAIVATDPAGKTLSTVVPGESATTEPVDEKVAPIQPIKLIDSKVHGQYAGSSSITGQKNLPLSLSLHGSQSVGGGAGEVGDLYVYFATHEMGWRDGLPGIFNVYERRGKDQSLVLFTRDSVENPAGSGVIETCWFGYYCVPYGASHTDPRAYNFTENRLEWLIKWILANYQGDPTRVYSGGQSMGGMGSTHFAFRHPELFAAVYPKLGRIRQGWLPCVPPVGSDLPTSINKGYWKKADPLMDDGKTTYWDRQDSVKWVNEHPEDLPFYCWCFGRKDTVAPWTDNLEMAKALTDGHHGFAFVWNNEGHSSAGGAAMELATKYYPASKFARGRSYPAFGNSSINSNFGNGERDNGDLIGGFNLGFDWTEVADEAGSWSAKLSNDLCKDGPMTVDVTPRQCQKFKPKAGEKYKWTNSAGGEGEVTADKFGLVTIEKVTIKPGEATTLKISKVE